MEEKRSKQAVRQEKQDGRERMGDVRRCIGSLLEEMGRQASRVTAAMAFRFIRRGGAASGLYVVPHAEHPVRVVMMGDDRHAQHQYAEKQQEICGVPLGFHLRFFFGRKDKTFLRIIASGLETISYGEVESEGAQGFVVFPVVKGIDETYFCVQTQIEVFQLGAKSHVQAGIERLKEPIAICVLAEQLDALCLAGYTVRHIWTVVE